MLQLRPDQVIARASKDIASVLCGVIVFCYRIEEEKPTPRPFKAWKYDCKQNNGTSSEP